MHNTLLYICIYKQNNDILIYYYTLYNNKLWLNSISITIHYTTYTSYLPDA